MNLPSVRPLLGAATALLTLALLSGCTADLPQTDEPAETSTTDTRQPDAAYALIDAGPIDVPSAAATTFSFTNERGYTFDVSVSLGLGGPVRTDITDAEPGFTDAEVDIIGNVAVTNTTSGRTATLGDLSKLSLMAVWPTASSVCSSLNTHEFYGDGDGGTGPGVCAPIPLNLASAAATDSTTVGIGATATYALRKTLSAVIAEDTAATFVSDAQKPLAWGAAMYGKAPSPTGAAKDCRWDEGGNPYLLWASVPIKHCAIAHTGTDFNLAVSADTRAKADTAIAAIVAAHKGVEDTIDLPSCPAGDVAQVSIATSGIDTTSSFISRLQPFGAIECNTDNLKLSFAARSKDNATPQAVANSIPGVSATAESFLYGGTVFAWCSPSSSGTDSNCHAQWYDDGLVVQGTVAQYDGTTEIQKVQRVRSWFDLNLPGMLSRLSTTP